MMKILWIVNIILPEIAKTLGISFSNREGWLTGAFNAVNSENNGIEISVACPTAESELPKTVITRGIKCYLFEENLLSPEIYDENLETQIKEILDDCKPDIVHIFGTEFPHALAAAKVFGKPEKTLVGIQGICTRIAEDYMALLPEKVCRSVTFRDLVKKDSLKRQQEKFTLRGKNERELLRISGNVAGRTPFDEEFSLSANPDRRYFKINETMRSSFYDGKHWSPDEAVPCRIFLGQGDYPIKGMHFLLEALNGICESFPQVSVRIAGNSIIRHKTLKDKIKIPAYGKYLRKLIKKYNLEERITVTGPLSEEEMKNEYLKCSVYVCPSYIENSPNTIAEAMLLGVPVVASNAGGIPGVIGPEEGMIFERGDSEALRECIERVFRMEKERNKELFSMTLLSIKRATRDYDSVNNLNDLITAYNEIGKE